MLDGQHGGVTPQKPLTHSTFCLRDRRPLREGGHLSAVGWGGGAVGGGY